VGLGQACVDVLGKVPRHPEEDTKTELLDLEIQCGGPASTAMVTLARLGARPALLGSVGDDAFGKRIRDRLEAEGVDVSGLRSAPGRTSQFAFIAVTRDTGRRTVFWHPGSAPPLGPGDVDLSCFPGARILHLDGLMVAASMEAARQAHRRGMLVVLDAGTLREGSLDLIREVDVLIASERFTDPLTGGRVRPEESLRALREHCAGRLVVTLGEKGSLGHDGVGFVRQHAFPVEAEDTTGAGDVYHGAYIYGLLQGWSMARCMRYGGAAAAMNCTRTGAQGGIPNRASLEAFLAGSGARPA
jgi:ribokinase